MKDLSESRILIVDDAKTNIDILVEALRDEYKLSVAVDGTAALRSVEKSPPDLVLLDIVMPGLDGYEVCRQLRAQESTRELPIMFLSSLEDVKDKTRGFEVGGNDYLTKPFEVLEVKARVRSLLKAKAYADAIREAMARDLRIAREIQMGILPADLAEVTSGTDLDVHAIIEPAQKVGGDLYEVLRASDDRIVVALGDVSGKGIPAALILSSLKTLFRTFARETVEPAAIAEGIAAAFYEQYAGLPYATAIVARFEAAPRRLVYVNAGHPAGYLLRKGLAPVTLESGGRPLGLLPGATYVTRNLELGPGDVGVLVSDGITEALEAGPTTLSQILAKGERLTTGSSPAEICDRLLRAAATGAGPAGVSDWQDDRTVFVFSVEPGV